MRAAGHVHHTVHHDRCDLQTGSARREDELGLQLLHIGGVYLVERTVTVTIEQAVVGGPFAAPGFHHRIHVGL